MARKIKPRNWRAIGLFCVLLVLGGLGLAATNSLENPFQVLTQLSGTSERGRFEGGERTSGERGAPPAGERGAMRGESGINDVTLNLDQLGNVLFDLWFIGVMSAILMFLSILLTYIKQRWSRRSLLIASPPVSV